jgi:predicted enzyme related to lactoylglutathione lyase
MANSIVHFEIFASDVERARRFYEAAFQWQFEAGGPPDFYHIATGPGTDSGVTIGLLTKRRGPVAEGSLNAFRVTISVLSITASMTAIEAAGGKLRSPVVSIPRVGQVVEFADTEGNVACIFEYVSGHPLVAK